ncbi:MAG: ATP-binding protein [Muribaculaceae bacterium]|nr:ATP-binding protein [Muribaculaceae bacterium]
MIKNFKVENCLSIRDEQELDFVATGDNTYEDFTVVKKNNTRLSKIGLIYGANASGKSNVVFALNWLVKFIRGSKDSIVMYAPFLLDEESRNKPSKMFLSFYIDDTLYEYSLVIQENVVKSEKLVRYPLGRSSLVFDRKWNEDTNSSEITFGASLKLSTQQNYSLTAVTLSDISVIAAYSNNNIPKIEVFEDVKKYFRRQILPFLSRKDDVENFSNSVIKAQPQVKDFILKFLSQADFNISDIIIKEEKTEIPDDVWEEIQKLSNIFEGTPERTYTEDQLFFQHSTLVHTQVLPEGVESVGTNRMYGLAAYLFFLTKWGTVMMADEIESSLHYDLLRYFVQLFLLNSPESQMICSTHSLLLLDEPFIRRDSIHICTKDNMGATEVVRASEFGLRKGVSILKAYREGKLGGIPRLGGLMLDKA